MAATEGVTTATGKKALQGEMHPGIVQMLKTIKEAHTTVESIKEVSKKEFRVRNLDAFTRQYEPDDWERVLRLMGGSTKNYAEGLNRAVQAFSDFVNTYKLAEKINPPKDSTRNDILLIEIWKAPQGLEALIKSAATMMANIGRWHSSDGFIGIRHYSAMKCSSFLFSCPWDDSVTLAWNFFDEDVCYQIQRDGEIKCNGYSFKPER